MVEFQSSAITPTRSPSKRPIMITQGQKQALIDNLQLEITERARKLRAQYALQAHNLRARIELRVNRIPTAMRTANMGELYEKYLDSTRKQTSKSETKQLAEKAEAPERPATAKSTVAPPKKPTTETAPPPPHGTKRPSDHFSAEDDKENTPDPTIPLQSKKRPKPNNHHPSNPATPWPPTRVPFAHSSAHPREVSSPTQLLRSKPASLSPLPRNQRRPPKPRQSLRRAP
ncbi:MAG: hypothetical protein Q9198_007001 [Flavoplaca austrocitrina]